ncbi:MAG: sulfurtransferase [Reichenbachiella sp.]|uniref:sulfurtransferase n=1 Tax=Reichenbachiella sp. TaxID=2184521 RepID=UPI00326359FF
MKKNLVTPLWLSKNLNDPDLIILDASPIENKAGAQSKFEGCYIPGARHFDLKHTFSDSRSNLPHMFPTIDQSVAGCRALGIGRQSKIVIYDNLGIYMSPRVWWMLRALGCEQVAVLDGGLSGWISNGYKVESRLSTIIEEGNFQASMTRDHIKTIDDMVENLREERYTAVDARSSGRFQGLAPEPRAGLSSGHIPGSINIPYTEVIENGRYKSIEDLKKVFEEKGIGEKPLIFLCGSGVTACIVLLAAALVLDNASYIYDGSWTEWASTPGPPIRK